MVVAVFVEKSDSRQAQAGGSRWLQVEEVINGLDSSRVESQRSKSKDVVVVVVHYFVYINTTIRVEE